MMEPDDEVWEVSPGNSEGGSELEVERSVSFIVAVILLAPVKSSTFLKFAKSKLHHKGQEPVNNN